MKRTVKVLLIMIVAVLAMTTVVSASTTSDLIDYVNNSEARPYLTDSDMVRIERYLKQYPITAAEEKEIEKKLDETIKVVNGGSLHHLTADQKKKCRDLANEVAAILDINLVFKSDRIYMYKDGKWLETVYIKHNQFLVYTGNQTNTLAITATAVVAIVALATAVYVVNKKRVTVE